MIWLVGVVALVLGIGIGTVAAVRWKRSGVGVVLEAEQAKQRANDTHTRLQATLARAEAIEQGLLREKWQGNASGIVAPSRKLIT